MIDNKIIPDSEFITIKGVYATLNGFIPIVKVAGKIGEYSGDNMDGVMEYLRDVAKVDFFYIRSQRSTFWNDVLTDELLKVGRVGTELKNGGYYPLKMLRKR